MDQYLRALRMERSTVRVLRTRRSRNSPHCQNPGSMDESLNPTANEQSLPGSAFAVSSPCLLLLGERSGDERPCRSRQQFVTLLR
jgi:hypothetical protein